MKGTMGSEGINKFAKVIQRRMKQVYEQPAVLDFGTINEDLSLITNNFPVPIPKPDYIICSKAIDIKAGSRVLVAWVGDDACIIDGVFVLF